MAEKKHNTNIATSEDFGNPAMRCFAAWQGAVPRGRIIMWEKHKIIIALCAVLLLVSGGAAGMFFAVKLQHRAPMRPVVCDRTGKVLLTDNRKSMFAMPARRAEVDGKFAAALLGHTTVKKGKRIGVSGVEYLIDHNEMTGKRLVLALDAGIQEKCEALLDTFCGYSIPQYAHMTVIDSDGALVAAAQRPVIDLNNRGNVDRRGTVFMAAAYIFPVSDAWMRLLGSRSDVLPEEKAKLRFHLKPGLFPGEGRGGIPGVNRLCYHAADHSQFTTVLNFLLACAGRMENKDIPSLKVFAPQGGMLPAVKIGNFQWRSLLWSKSCSTLSGLGTASAGNGKNLYILLRVVFRDQDGNRLETGERILPAEYCSLLEKAVRTFPENGPLSAEDDASLVELKTRTFTGKVGANGFLVDADSGHQKKHLSPSEDEK